MNNDQKPVAQNEPTTEGRRDAEAQNILAKDQRKQSSNRCEKRNKKDKRSHNSPEWYNRYPELAKAAGAVSFGTPLGLPFPLRPVATPPSTAGGAPSTLTPGSYTGPGIAKIKWIPAIGISLDKTSPVNLAALNIFVNLRAKQKAAHDYDSQDMMMGILALDSCYMYMRLVERIYGVARAAQSVENYYYNRTVLAALNVNYSDVFKNLANLRTYLLTFQASIEKYTLPAGLNFTERHQWMCKNLYLDADSRKAQTYLFNPEFLYVYDNTVATGSQLVPVLWDATDSPLTTADIIAVGEQLLTAINGDDDIGYICGDLFNAYGAAAFTAVPPMAEDYTLLPMYDEAVLKQISNIYFVGQVDSVLKDPIPKTHFNVTQNPTVNNGAILYNPWFYWCDPTYGGRPNTVHLCTETLLNARAEIPDPLDVIYMSRFIPVINAFFPNSDQYAEFFTLASCGSEIATSFDLYDVIEDRGQVNRAMGSVTNSIAFTTTDTAAAERIWLIAATELQAFDWAWPMMIFTRGTSGNITLEPELLCDIHNLTKVSRDDMIQIQRAALLSLFDMPRISPN